MLSVIVFSKERPLQLQAYLESLLYYSGIKEKCIYVLYKASGTISYQALISQYRNVNWIPENDFYSDLVNILKQAENYILWGCDDVFYKSAFSINTCIEALCKDEELFGFSLRLGRNIQPNPAPELIYRDSYLIWDWAKVYLPHPLYPQEVWDWGYPWEVSGTIYRKKDICDFLKLVDEPINPNYLEGNLANIFRQSRGLQKRKYLACFALSKCLTLTVNRVQETHPNPFDSAKNTTPIRLYKYFAQGQKLNWFKFKNCNNLVIHVASEYFELQINELKNTNSISSPLVSVICRTYNREEYIEELIVSVLAQTFTDFELLILDDGSTDNTKNIVEKYLSDTRINYVYQQNIGTTKDGFSLEKVLNRAIELTTAELVCFGDSDDVFMPNKLERQVRELQVDPDLDIVFSDAYHINEHGDFLTSDFRFAESLSFNELNLLRILFRKNIVPNPSVMMKRKAIELMGGFETGTGFCHDYQFWLKSAPYLKFKYIDEKLIKYRIHDKGITTGSGSNQRVVQESVKVLCDVRTRFSILDLYPEIYACRDQSKALYSAYLEFGNTMLTANIPVVQIAIQEYQKALNHNPQEIKALNNLAVAFFVSGNYQNSFHIFEHLKNTAYNSDEVKHNVDLVSQVQTGIAIANSDFILLRETTETSELLKVSLEHASQTSRQETYRIWNEYGSLQRGVLPTSSIPVPISPSELNALPYRTDAQPLISVIIPCYNHARFLGEAVESIINQTYENWECIIVDDGSPDNTSDVASSLIKYYKNKIIHLLEKQNSGIIDARNAGFSQSSGEYILFLDADDKIHPDFLKEAVSILKDRLDVGFVYTDIQYFGVKNYQISHGDFNHSQFVENNQATVTSLFRRKIHNQVGGFKKIMEGGLEDWEFWISAYEKGWQGYRLGKPYLYYRQHSTGSRLQNLISSQSNLELQRAKIINLHSKLYSNEEVLWSDHVLCKHSNLSATDVTESNLLPDSEQFLSALSRQAYQYQQEPPDQSVLANLRQARKQIAELWVSLPIEQLASNYSGTLGKAHHSLLNSRIKNETLTDSEQTFADQVVAHLVRGFDQPKAIHYLLAAMLYSRADQLPLQHDITYIPQWLLSDYLKYMLDSPHLFEKLGESNNYYRYVQRCMNYLNTSIFSNPNSAVWRSVATEFSQIANFIPLYFNKANLKDIYVKRADILEWVLKLNGYEINYEFGDRPVNRKKIRIGILAAHFTPTAETFASLPVYEYISRDYEVILYSLSQTGHPLEQYCQSCANSFKLLPKDLANQVNLIRADDLDILFIATNVTAVTNQICLLSLHRLARVQVTSVGSVVTTGIRHIDYYISGQLTDPLVDAEQHYREKLVKLEGTAHCFSYGSEIEKATVKVERESLGISEETVVFISGANVFKIIPKLIDTWAKIIAVVPNSVLVLLPFGPNWSNAYPKQAFLNRFSTIFSEHGIAADRLMVLAPQPVPNREDVKEYLKIADVYLDSHPFSGTTSLIEPLEVGLPVIAIQGTSLRSAMGAAMLQALNIPDLVADSNESYIQLAIALGTNPELRKQKSAQVKQRMQDNPSFLDSRSYSAQMGALFQELLRKHQANNLTDTLKLRDINLIIFPDWSQPEDILYQDLASVITNLVNHPDKNQMTLLIETGNLSEDEANLLLSDIVINLLLEEDLDVADGPEISLVGHLGEMQWEALLPQIQARIVLEKDQQAMSIAGTTTCAAVKVENIPVLMIDGIIHKENSDDTTKASY